VSIAQRHAGPILSDSGYITRRLGHPVAHAGVEACIGGAKKATKTKVKIAELTVEKKAEINDSVTQSYDNYVD
jgi:hypothetical protein